MDLSRITASKSCCLLPFCTCADGEAFGITCHGGRVSVACVEGGPWPGPVLNRPIPHRAPPADRAVPDWRPLLLSFLKAQAQSLLSLDGLNRRHYALECEGHLYTKGALRLRRPQLRTRSFVLLYCWELLGPFRPGRCQSARAPIAFQLHASGEATTA